MILARYACPVALSRRGPAPVPQGLLGQLTFPFRRNAAITPSTTAVSDPYLGGVERGSAEEADNYAPASRSVR
jgi:hypothetical protein